MTRNSLDGIARLRGSGVGTIVGGLVVGVLSIPFSYAWASAIVVGFGILGWVIARRYGAPTPIFVGSTAIGGIVGIEAATAYGIGVSPAVLVGAAVAFGVVDVVLGGLLGRRRPGTA